MKTFAPYLFPRAQRILHGDAKCNRGGVAAVQRAALAAAERRPGCSAAPGVEPPQCGGRVCPDVGPAAGAQERAYRELTAQLGRYEREPYPALRAVGVLADTFCLGWRRTARALEHSCRWTREVALQMREQCSFDHSIPADLQLAWVPYW